MGRPSLYTEAVELYALSDPETGEVRYLGKANDSQKRLKSHLRDSLRRRTPVYDWIRSLTVRGLTPNVTVLMCAWDWREAERTLIAQARAEVGRRLLNVADGGDEPFCPLHVRQENARKNTAARLADPQKTLIHALLQRLGQMARFAKTHRPQRVAELQIALTRIKRLAQENPDELFARIQRSRLARVL